VPSVHTFMYPRILAVATALCGIALGWLVFETREFNFDVVVYAGAARAWLGEPADQIRRDVYRELGEEASDEEVKTITSLSEYREHVASDTEQFMVQLPIGQVKLLFVLLVEAGVKMGDKSVLVPFRISAAAYGVFGALLLLALARVAPVPIAFPVGLALLLSPPFLEVGRMPTPDALSACLMLTAVYALLFAERPWLAAAIMLLGITARTNNAILCIALASWWGWKNRDWRIAPLGGGLAVAASLTVTRLAGGYSWGILFTHAFLRRLSDPASIRSDVNVSNYFGLLLPALGGANILYPSVASLFVAVAALGFAAYRHQPDSPAPMELAVLLAAVWSALLAHFLVFPLLADRFFMVHYACTAIATAGLVAASSGRPGRWFGTVRTGSVPRDGHRRIEARGALDG
jgi:hypothetical protein